jgi:hypothetical protein
MIVAKFNSTQFAKEMNNLMEYSAGFLTGVQRGKIRLLEEVGEKTKEILGQYLDSNARVNPELLHHVYEWYRTGSPEARLFNLNYNAAAGSLSVNSTFTQSTSIKNGSRVPFYNKAAVMERGISVTISPRNSEVLSFEDNGEQIFTRGPVNVENPGGSQVAGGFEKVFSEFFNKYFTQSFMRASGLDERLRNPIAFVKNFSKGKNLGKSLGNDVGYRWIAGKAGM